MNETHSAENSPRVHTKIALNKYGFRVTAVRVLGQEGKDVLWECYDQDLIENSSKKEVNMTVGVF